MVNMCFKKTLTLQVSTCDLDRRPVSSAQIRSAARAVMNCCSLRLFVRTPIGPNHSPNCVDDNIMAFLHPGRLGYVFLFFSFSWKCLVRPPIMYQVGRSTWVSISKTIFDSFLDVHTRSVICSHQPRIQQREIDIQIKTNLKICIKRKNSAKFQNVARSNSHPPLLNPDDLIDLRGNLHVLLKKRNPQKCFWPPKSARSPSHTVRAIWLL